MIDKIVENMETALEKLGNTLTNEKKRKHKKQDSSYNKQPFPSIRYPTEEQSKLKEKSKESFKLVKPKNIPEPPKQVIKGSEEIEKRTDIFQSSIDEKSSIVEGLEIDNFGLETHFIDVGKETKLIHLFGPPSGGKTTLALQSAIEILPKETFYIITSHSTSVLKRVKQMAIEERWKDYPDLKQFFYPIQIQNLKELKHQIEQIINFSSQELGLVIIDHITDYVRGEIHKEENRNLLRSILEDLYMLTNKKKCKAIIINGYAFKGSAPAEDLIESFCDMTIKITNERKDFEIEIDDEVLTSFRINNSGFENIHLNIYF
jgi:hypothetical protein